MSDFVSTCGSSLVAEHPVPTGGSGSIPTLPLQLFQKTPICRLLTADESNRMLVSWHYLGAVKGILFSVGHDEGCCVFTNCRSRIYEKKHPGVIELGRMVGMPRHRWAMSSLMAQAARECKKRGYNLIVTYSDPDAGHTGQVYRAAGYTDDGLIGKDGHPHLFLDGKRMAPRTFYDRHGTQSVPKLKEIYGDRLETKSKSLKNRWVLYLTPARDLSTMVVVKEPVDEPKRLREQE